MAKRRRARMGDKTVTIISNPIPRRGMVDVRDATGYRQKVNVKDLKLIPEGEQGSTLKFGNSDD
jgi:hypothetical protein